MSNFDISNPIYFNKESENYGIFNRIIIQQGQLSCRNQLDISYIKSCLEKFTDGYIYLDMKSTIGRTVRSKADKYFLKSYCLFVYDEDSLEINGLITCGHENYPGSGLIVLNSVLNFVNEFKVRNWILNSLPFEKLVNYYKSLGFNEVYTKYLMMGKKKVIVMIQNFDHPEENEEENNDINCNLNDKINNSRRTNS